MPNENAIIYGIETQSDVSRQKRAIPLGLIFSGVSTIGGLIMKGVNMWTNYKKSKAMTKAVEKLYEAQEIDHRRLTRLEGQTSLLAKTKKTAFQHIDYRLLHLDTKLNYTVQHMTEFFKRTETHFRFTWEALVSNRLAIHLLSSGSAMYDMVLQQYLHYYQNYDVTLDHFLTWLDTLGTGRLTFQVLDPDELDRFLSAIRRQLREERSPFELAFNHTYQFYAEPMVMFTNTHDQLLVNVPILLRLATQKPLNLYSIDTVPMPFDTEMLDGKNNEYTFINNSYPYMALNEHNYIPLTETQLRMCDKMGSTYYCQNSYVLCQRTQHTCELAIYYKMDAKTITKHCQAKFTANVNPSTLPACVKAYSLPPTYPDQINFQPPTLPQNWGDKGAEGKQKLTAQLTAWITTILIIIALLVILYTIFKKCWYVSSLPRVCFPLYPFSTILRGTARTDIFVEVVNLASAEAMWAHFTSMAVHPSQLQITGYLHAYDMHIIKLCCCRQLQIDWQNIVLCDLDQNIIKLPTLGKISLWSTNDLESIETNISYQIRVYRRVLDLVIPLEIKNDVNITDHRLY